MTEPVDGWTIAEKAWGILITVLGFFSIRALVKLDRTAKEVELLKAQVVMREQYELERQQDRKEMADFRREVVDAMTRNADRLESSNRQVMQQFSETQNLILEKLLK